MNYNYIFIRYLAWINVICNEICDSGLVKMDVTTRNISIFKLYWLILLLPTENILIIYSQWMEGN